MRLLPVFLKGGLLIFFSGEGTLNLFVDILCNKKNRYLQVKMRLSNQGLVVQIA